METEIKHSTRVSLDDFHQFHKLLHRIKTSVCMTTVCRHQSRFLVKESCSFIISVHVKIQVKMQRYSQWEKTM